MRHAFRKITNTQISPTNEAGLKAWQRLTDGDLFWFEAGRQRSIKHHRLYWATMDFFAEHSSGRTAEQVHTLMKDLTGRYDLLEKRDGSVVRHYHKTDFASMDEDAFREYHEEVKDALWREVMPDVPEGHMRKQLEDFLK